MRVTSNTFPDSLIHHLQRTTWDMAKLNEQISSGQRFSKLSEDAAAATQILDMQEEKSRLTQFSRNIDRAENINNSTISRMQDFIRVSDRVNEIATLANDLKGPDGLRAYADEVNQLIEHAIQGANARFNGEYIFGGTDTGNEPFTVNRDGNGKVVDPDGAGAGVPITYDGAAQGAEFHISETGKISPFTDGAQNQKLADFINRMVRLRDALESGSSNAVDQTLRQDLETSEDDLIYGLSSRGSTQLRLEYEKNLGQERFAALETRISGEADVDIAQAIVKLTQAQTAYQATLQSAGQVLGSSLLQYI